MICKTNIPIIKITSGGGGEGGYVRPEGVPNGEDIIENAPDFEVEGVVYEPVYYMALRDTFITKTFSKTGTGVSTGADAFVFSDEPTTIYVGDTTHTFDVTKDFETDESWKCRYVICYATAENKASTSGIVVSLYNYSNTFEFIGANGTIFPTIGGNLFGNITDSACKSIKYVNIENCSFQNNRLASGSYMAFCRGLETFKFPNNLPEIDQNMTQGFNQCNVLKTLSLPAVTKLSGSLGSFNYSLKKLSIPNLTRIDYLQSSLFSATGISELSIPNLTIINCGTKSIFANCFLLEYVDLSSLTTWVNTSSTSFGWCTFIKLPTNFDFNALNFTGNVTKSYEWLNNELPTKLKDNSGGTAKTLTLGAANIALITPANQAIIANKNWTLL